MLSKASTDLSRKRGTAKAANKAMKESGADDWTELVKQRSSPATKRQARAKASATPTGAVASGTSTAPVTSAAPGTSAVLDPNTTPGTSTAGVSPSSTNSDLGSITPKRRRTIHADSGATSSSAKKATNTSATKRKKSVAKAAPPPKELDVSYGDILFDTLSHHQKRSVREFQQNGPSPSSHDVRSKPSAVFTSALKHQLRGRFDDDDEEAVTPGCSYVTPPQEQQRKSVRIAADANGTPASSLYRQPTPGRNASRLRLTDRRHAPTADVDVEADAADGRHYAETPEKAARILGKPSKAKAKQVTSTPLHRLPSSSAHDDVDSGRRVSDVRRSHHGGGGHKSSSRRRDHASTSRPRHRARRFTEEGVIVGDESAEDLYWSWWCHIL